MSGDVQPRKRKDKKRKKDDLGVEEPRGTAAVFGEGDVFMHSYQEHGTGGHWCAKIIFFSLLAVLITLIGLIILENRGLSELEANAVESRYSGVLEGWLEDVPEDDHHDEHTLELKDHDDDEGQNEDLSHGDDEEENLSDEADDENQSEESDDAEDDEDEEDHDDDEENADDNEQAEDDESQEQDLENDETKDVKFKQEQDYDVDDQTDNNDSYEHDNKEIKRIESNEDNDGSEEAEENDDHENYGDETYDDEEINDNADDDSRMIDNNDDDSEEIKNNSVEENDEDKNEDEEEHEEEDEDDDVELERLENEVDEANIEPISVELPALPEDDSDDEKDEETSNEVEPASDDESPDDEDEYLEMDDIDDSNLVEHITPPPGKPLVEVEEDEDSSEQPPDSLAEEEEYEKRQEELRREEEQSSHIWLKLGVGGALLAATHAVMRRATLSRGATHAVMRRATLSRDTPEREESASREETPVGDRRMTLIPEEHPIPVSVKKAPVDVSQPKFEKFVETVSPIVKTIPIKEDSEEEEEDNISDDEEIQEIKTDDKELYSDDEEMEEDEEVVEEKKEVPKEGATVTVSKPAEDEELEEDPDDVEIIDDEQLEEEVEEEEDEDISDVDDVELLTRLEAKYGKLPEPERPGYKQYKDGGNSLDDDWPGEPSDPYWRRQLESAERELRQGQWSAATERASAEALRGSGRARWITARALDSAAEAKRDNRLLTQAITAYLELLKMNERLSDKKLLEITTRTLDRIQFRGNYLNAEPIYRLLIRRFPNEPAYRNNMTVSFLMANRNDLAEQSLKETLQRWPNDRVALAHYGFILKMTHKRYEEAVESFRKALEGDTGPAVEARFYYHYGDSLLLLARFAEAHEVHKRAAALGLFLSPAQRSFYNVPHLKSSPWWNIEETPYVKLAKALEKSWREILKEGEAAKALYEKEKEGLKERGEWSQLDLFVRGREISDRCKTAPVTCSIVKTEAAAAGCRRGQVKFSAMVAGTHVRPHVGPTNCRLRMHLGLSNTKDTYIRVDQEIRQWQVGKVLMFDDSFEHEVWHNGTGTRLVLIVDVWHPDLTPLERRQLPAI